MPRTYWPFLTSILIFTLILYFLTGCTGDPARAPKALSGRPSLRQQTEPSPPALLTQGTVSLPDQPAQHGAKKSGTDGSTGRSGEKVSSIPGSGDPPKSAGKQAELIFHGSRQTKKVALTFDACEDENPRGYDAKITEILKANQVPATIFLGGKWVESHPAAARELGSCPLFELGNHSYLHPDFTKISVQRMREEILRTQNIVEKATGQRPRLFRFPFGRYTSQALQVVEELGLKSIQWDVVTGDPDPNIKAADIEREVLRQTRGGSIIIMHINGRGWHTAEALPKIIKGLREKGFEFVTVSQLLPEKP